MHFNCADLWVQRCVYWMQGSQSELNADGAVMLSCSQAQVPVLAGRHIRQGNETWRHVSYWITADTFWHGSSLLWYLLLMLRPPGLLQQPLAGQPRCAYPHNSQGVEFAVVRLVQVQVDAFVTAVHLKQSCFLVRQQLRAFCSVCLHMHKCSCALMPAPSCHGCLSLWLTRTRARVHQSTTHYIAHVGGTHQLPLQHNHS